MALRRSLAVCVRSTAPVLKHVDRPRHSPPSITLRELRKAHKERHMHENPAQKEFMSLLHALQRSDGEADTPEVQKCATAVDEALKSAFKKSNKSYTLYQLSRYVKRH
mmetsp:Transcript_12550/g.36373  ORF Transcript_12550/g.36373 Transcript_12550/m.36373 type:complete len:108 (-) Transcript_12550:129-452(-)